MKLIPNSNCVKVTHIYMQLSSDRTFIFSLHSSRAQQKPTQMDVFTDVKLTLLHERHFISHWVRHNAFPALGNDPSLDHTYGGCGTDERGESIRTQTPSTSGEVNAANWQFWTWRRPINKQTPLGSSAMTALLQWTIFNKLPLIMCSLLSGNDLFLDGPRTQSHSRHRNV